MFSLRHTNSTRARGHTAVLVRERLLQDQTMRRNSTTPPCTASQPVSSTTAALPLYSTEPLPIPHHIFSPSEQIQQATRIAHSFKNYYLAEITHLKNRHLTIATIKPAIHRKNDRAQKILCYADGNILIRHCAIEKYSRQHLILYCVCFILFVALTILGAFAWFVVI